MFDEIDILREEINRLDSEIIELLKARMAVVADVATYKKQNNIEIFSAGREDSILKIIAEKSGEELASYTTEIYKEIMKQSKEYQKHLNL